MEKERQKIKEFYRAKKTHAFHLRDRAPHRCTIKNRRRPTYHETPRRENFLGKDTDGRLIPGALFYDVKVLGLVETGFPSATEEEFADTMSYEYLMPNKESAYMLKMKGESMKDAGIIDGDTVLVERTQNPKEGQIVIAKVNGGWTTKYLRRKNGISYLEPANEKSKPIFPRTELRIAAVIRAVIRKY